MVCVQIFQSIANRVLGENDADLREVEVLNWENFVMTIAYIADLRTFKQEYD